MFSFSITAVATLVVVTSLVAENNLVTAASRSVNISSQWFLPQEGFPVFYRYFKDRITWFEADAVCQFHHANLVTVDTSVQYDATRAYLKELDIATNVWIGLKRVSASDSFAWTDYKKLDPTGGYWQEQVPKSASPLCAAADPSADFRWHSLNCGGPEVASFICELPVPSWARKEDGCLLTALPSLTVIFLPEQGAVELASDCGLDGTRRIACKGQANREEMMRQLSCDHETTSPDDTTGSSSSSEVTSSSVGSTGARTSQSQEASTGTTGSRGYTGHSQEPPTRHRRDADVLTSSATTAVSEEASPNTTTESRNHQLSSAGTEPTTAAVSMELSTVSTTLKDELTDTSSVSTQTEEVTTDKQTTNEGPQLSTISESSTYTMTEEVTNTSPSEETSTTTNVEGGFIQVRELEVIAENNTGNYVEVESTSTSITTINPITSELPSKTTNATQVETVGTPAPTEVVSESGNIQLADLKEPNNDKNVTTGYASEYTTTTTDATVVSKSSINNTETMEFISAIREEMLNYSVNSNSQKADEIKSREEAEEERLKEEERKEAERKFKEEQDNRRRQFLPTPLRSLPETRVEASSPPPAPPVMEEYEEPEEVMEPEPEAPARPNRGRRLTRPQPHSFYPYFLNRVLG